MQDLETTALYALGIPLVALLFFVEAWLARRRRVRIFSFAETFSNFSAGLGTLVIGLFTGPLVYALYEFGYAHAIVSWHGSLWRYPFALLLADLCYYVHHRAGHRFAALWAIHGVHHQHESLNSSVGLRLEWLADLSTIVFFSPMPLLGLDPACGFAAVAALSFYTLTTHSPVLAPPSFGVLVTAATHGAHHSRDARYSGKNFGAMFTFWDRLLGTYRPHGMSEPLRADVPSVCRCHDGVAAQVGLVRELFARLRREKSMRSALRVIFGRPEIDPLAPQASVPRADADIPSRTRVYVALDFTAVLALAIFVLWRRDAEPRAELVLVAVLLVWSLRTIGGVLDARPYARKEQLARLAFSIVVALFVARLHPVVAALMTAHAFAFITASAVLVAPEAAGRTAAER